MTAYAPGHHFCLNFTTQYRAMKKYYIFLFFVFAHFYSHAQPTLSFSSFITGLTKPVDIVNAGDGSNRLFIVQQSGQVKIYSGGSILASPFLNMSSLITYDGNERGLLSIAFHPQYATNRYFFVFYNNLAGNTELAQYQTLASDPNTADPASRKILMTFIKPFTNHNGCKLNFGPDGDLYFATGDGGSGGDPNNNAQNLNAYLGKMMRINVDNFTVAPYYTVPADNPLVGQLNTKPEIFDWGLRNPWRWSFDRLTGDMWIADVGQNAWEELNMIPAANTKGLNFGWRCYEGNHAYDLSLCGATPATGKTFPIFEYGHNAAGGYAFVGGLVYHGAEFPALQGYYICADEVNTNGWLIKSNGVGGWNVGTQNNFPGSVSTFGEAENGTLYVASLAGTIYKVISSGVVAVRLISFDVSSNNGRDLLDWKITPDPSLSKFELQYSVDGISFNAIHSVDGITGPADYHFETPSSRADRWYRLKIIYHTGGASYSPIKKLNGNAAEIIVTGTPATDPQLINTVSLRNVVIINAVGQRVRSLGAFAAGTHQISSADLAKGTYYLQCVRENGVVENLKLMLY